MSPAASSAPPDSGSSKRNEGASAISWAASGGQVCVGKSQGSSRAPSLPLRHSRKSSGGPSRARMGTMSPRASGRTIRTSPVRGEVRDVQVPGASPADRTPTAVAPRNSSGTWYGMTFPLARSVMSSWPETIRHERWASARATPSRSECGLPINAMVFSPLASTTAWTNENRSRSTENGGTGGGTLLQPRNARRSKGGPSLRRTTSSAQAPPDTECPGRGYANSTWSRSAAR